MGILRRENLRSHLHNLYYIVTVTLTILIPLLLCKVSCIADMQGVKFSMCKVWRLCAFTAEKHRTQYHVCYTIFVSLLLCLPSPHHARLQEEAGKETSATVLSQGIPPK